MQREKVYAMPEGGRGLGAKNNTNNTQNNRDWRISILFPSSTLEPLVELCYNVVAAIIVNKWTVSKKIIPIIPKITGIDELAYCFPPLL